MPAHQEFQSAEHIGIRYEKKNDGDGDMLYLENVLTSEAFVLCGSNVEIFQLLENAISHVPMGDQEPPMKPIQSLIQKAHDKGLLRYAPPNLPWHVDQEVYQFELGRTSMSGVEFGYDLWLDKITWAVQSIDGAELEPDEFLQELQRAVGVEDQPCQHYAQKRAIVDEEPEVTSHNDEKERTYLVTQLTEVQATDDLQAIDRVNAMHRSSEVVSQSAEPKLVHYEVGDVNRYWAEDADHAIEQFKNDRLNTGDPNFIKEVE